MNAYTHDGSTQGDIRVIDGTNASTIPIRDANGRLKAADPASGATDKTLVTANWISQTGDSSPNNAVHRSGNETVNGTKRMTVGCNIATLLSADISPYAWYKVAIISPSRFLRISYNVSLPYNNSRYMIMDAVLITPRTADPETMSLIKIARVLNILNDTEYIGLAWDGSNFNLYIKSGSATHSCIYAEFATQAGALINANAAITPVTPVQEDPTTQLKYVII